MVKFLEALSQPSSAWERNGSGDAPEGALRLGQIRREYDDARL
jgi:hypothetical protein